MKKTIAFLLTGLLLFPHAVRAQEAGNRFLESVLGRFSELKDFTADVNVHFDMEAVRAPDMQGKIYHKAPDKMKLDSKQVLFFPREIGFFNPSMLKPEDFDVTLLEHLTYQGKKAVKLRLVPKKTSKLNQNLELTIDIEANLVREVRTFSLAKKEIKAAIDYGPFEGFDLPIQIQIQIDNLSKEPNETKEYDQYDPLFQRSGGVKGKVTITYSNYKVNSGLKDELFREKGSQRP